MYLIMSKTIKVCDEKFVLYTWWGTAIKEVNPDCIGYNNNANVTCMFYVCTTDKEILMSCLRIFCNIKIL